jgi:hypothetical protein
MPNSRYRTTILGCKAALCDKPKGILEWTTAIKTAKENPTMRFWKDFWVNVELPIG